MVILLSKNIITKRPSKKLDAKFLKSFKIVETKGKQVYKLDLPQIYSRIHNIFHVSLFKPYKQRLGNMLSELTPIKRQLEYEVERIKDMRNINGRIKYLVRWNGYSLVENSWESLEYFTNLQELIA